MNAALKPRPGRYWRYLPQRPRCAVQTHSQRNAQQRADRADRDNLSSSAKT